MAHFYVIHLLYVHAALKQHHSCCRTSKPWKDNWPFAQDPWAPRSVVWGASAHGTVHSLPVNSSQPLHPLLFSPSPWAAVQRHRYNLLGTRPTPTPLFQPLLLIFISLLSFPTFLGGHPFCQQRVLLVSKFILCARHSARCWDATEYKTHVVSASLTPAVWWGRQTSRQEFTVKYAKCCGGERAGVLRIQVRGPN